MSEQPGKQVENRISQGRLAEGPLSFVDRERSGSGDWGLLLLATTAGRAVSTFYSEQV